MNPAPSQAEEIVRALMPHVPLVLGSLRVWGDWFGKPLDNLHTLLAARHEADALILEFNEQEVLRVTRPTDWIVEPAAAGREPRLLIRKAERVEWGWFSYGYPKLPEHWQTEQHWVEAGGIRASTTATRSTPSFAPSPDEPAVAFL